MPTYRKILGQIVATTKEDLQGELLSKDELEHLVASYPRRMPLHQRHDFTLETIGYIENCRLEKDPEELGQYSIIADVSVEVDKADPDLKGFSISFTAKIASNSDAPKHFVYLPYPLYNDEELINEFLSLDESVFVGKFVKKQLDPVSIGLLGTGLAFALAPEWEIQYKERIRPLLVNLVSWIGRLRSRDASADLGQYVIGYNEKEIQLIFIPERGAEEQSFGPEAVEDGIRTAKKFLDNDQKAMLLGVNQIKMLWNPNKKVYVLLHVEYSDGSVWHHV
jgi:hypothetical protein